MSNVKSQMSNAEREIPELQAKARGWRAALTWGFGIALAHRLLLGLWMAFIWVYVGVNMMHRPMDYQPHGAAGLPELRTPFEQLALGLWRRWDARHYLTLAQEGYRSVDPGSSVFGPLTPLVIRLLDNILPGPVDIAGLVFGTLAFGLVLTLLYRLCEVYYQDAELGQRVVILTALLPLSFFFSAPMSDAIYLVMVLGMFYMGMKNRWGLVALLGALATLARLQGGMLAAIAGLLFLKQQDASMSLQQRVIDALKKGWPLILIPLSYVGFMVYRYSLGLPSLSETYRIYSFNRMVNPLEGILINASWHSTHLPESLGNADFLAILIVSVLLVLLMRYPRHRHLAWVAYSIGFSLLFISRINWEYGTDHVIATISFGRYALSLFPLIVLAADILRGRPYWIRLLVPTLLVIGLLVYSGQHALGMGPA